MSNHQNLHKVYNVFTFSSKYLEKTYIPTYGPRNMILKSNRTAGQKKYIIFKRKKIQKLFAYLGVAKFKLKKKNYILDQVLLRTAVLMRRINNSFGLKILVFFD